MIASSVVVANKKFSQQAGNSQNDSNSANTPAAKPTELAPEERNRGKRMMGVLLGTLSKFKSEEVDKSEANLKRILLEQKLTQKLHAAKGRLDQEPRTLFKANTETCLASCDFDISVGQVRRETDEACAQFQRTQTLPALFFKRANV